MPADIVEDVLAPSTGGVKVFSPDPQGSSFFRAYFFRSQELDIIPVKWHERRMTPLKVVRPKFSNRMLAGAGLYAESG